MTVDTDHRTTTDDDVTIATADVTAGLLLSADETVAQLTAQVNQLNRVIDELRKRLSEAGLNDMVSELLPRLIRYDE